MPLLSVKRFQSFLKRLPLISFSTVIILILISACTEPVLLPAPNQSHTGILKGQVFNLSHPGPIPIGWIPPPYENICVVIAEDVDKGIHIESLTDIKGKFLITLQPGTYYLRVKDSMLSSVTGPYYLHEGEILEAKANFDNGMR